MKSFVAIDLETTGLDPVDNEIIEIGAVRVTDGVEEETFSTLVRPQGELSLRVQRITGIRPADLLDGQAIEPAAKAFEAFVGGRPMIAHNAQFERNFLRPHTGTGFTERIVDSLEFARLVMPSLPRHDLESLIRHFGLAETEDHRALSDAVMAARVWLRLLDKLHRQPPAILEQLAWIAAAANSPLRPLIEPAAAKHPPGRAQIQSILRNFESQVGRRGAKRPAEPEHERLDPAEVTGHLEADQSLAHALDGYERRPEQLEMAGQVAEAFNDGVMLAVEAGTGTGKSMAYLIPAALWAIKNKERVVLSTHTKNLQEQLILKDIPLLEKTLGLTIRTAIAKGRANYLCVYKLFQFLEELRDEPIDRPRAHAIMPVLTWAAETEEGDTGELGAFSLFRSGDLWSRITSTGDDCAGRDCTYYNNCYLMKARQQVQEAQLIVANHAVVFADIPTDGALLPDYGYLVLDEAHNLENVATEHLRVEIGKLRLVRMLARLYRPSRKPHGSGLIPQAIHDSLSLPASADTTSVDRIVARGDAAIAHARQLTSEIDRLEMTIAGLFPRRGRSDRLRYHRNDQPEETWTPVRAAARSLIAEIGGLAASIAFITETLAELDKGSLPFRAELIKDLDGQASQLRQFATDTEMLVLGEDEDYVFWVERRHTARRAVTARLCAAPLDVAGLLKTELYDKKTTVILTSATMTVKGSFNFLLGRLGLDRLEEGRVRTAIIGSSFDYATQVQIGLANFLPEPTQSPDYDEALGDLLIDLYRATHGRGLALFTSYGMLRRVYNRIKPPLERAGILVLAQGIDGSRRGLTETFRKETASVLLGTSSFWEGVDLPGECLSCLTIARLPFQVVDDPVTAARCERIEKEGRDPFSTYSVPTAVLRFRQGFGRLIRSRTDRGVVIIADKRAKTKRYGSSFLRSLPTETVPHGTAADLLKAVTDFFASPDPAP